MKITMKSPNRSMGGTGLNAKLTVALAFMIIFSVAETIPILKALGAIDESSFSEEKVESQSPALRQVRPASRATASTSSPSLTSTTAPTIAPTTAPTTTPTSSSTTEPTIAPTTARATTATTAKAVATTTKKAAMCAIVLNEELYLDEFVDYHHALGFEKFLIYDNSKKFEMKQWGKLKGDHVEVIHFPGDSQQMPAYLDCGKKLNETGQYEWAAFFDVDEYLVLKKHEHVADMLEEHCNRGALVVNWLIFTSNGWNLQTPEPVTRRFQYYQALEPANQHVKSIVRLADVEELVHGDPHSFANVKSGSTVHDSNGKLVDGPFNLDHPRDVVVLHHYTTKSRKESIAKKMRGRSDMVATTPEEKKATRKALKMLKKDLADSLAGEDLPLATNNVEDEALVFDDSAWKFLKTHVPAYALFDEIGLIKTN